MAKKKKRQQKKQTAVKTARPSWLKLNDWQQKGIALVAVVLLIVIVFNPLLHKGLAPGGTDVVGSIGSIHQVHEYQKQSGEKALWNPWVFSGMPKHHRTLSEAEQILFQPTAWNSFVYYLLGAIGMFFLALFWGVPLWGAFLVSIAFVFLPHYLVLFQAGHFQKFRPILLMPWSILAFSALMSRGKLLNFFFFTIAFSVQMLTRHYQVLFYTLLIFLFIGIGYLIDFIKSKEYRTIAVRLIFLCLGIILSIGMNAHTLWPVHEYTPFSIRGGGGNGRRDWTTITRPTGPLHRAK